MRLVDGEADVWVSTARSRSAEDKDPVRSILAGYLGTDARSVRLELGEHGRPMLASSHGCSISFNVSHSRDLVVVGVTAGRTIGVDIERVRPGVWSEALTRAAFSRAELASVGDTAGADRELALFRAWTRKEGYLKALGQGLQDRLDRVSSLAPPGWTFWEFEPAPGYVGCVVVATPDR